MAATPHKVTQDLEQETPLPSAHKTRRKKTTSHAKDGRRARRTDKAQPIFDLSRDARARALKALTTEPEKPIHHMTQEYTPTAVDIRREISKAEMNKEKNKLLGSSASVVSVPTRDTNASSSKATPRATVPSPEWAARATRELVKFSTLPEKHDSYKFKFNMIINKCNDFISLYKKFDPFKENMKKILLLINKGFLVTLEIKLLYNKYDLIKQENNDLLLRYNQITSDSIKYLMECLAYKLFNDAYTSSRDIKLALEKCISVMEEPLKEKRIAPDLYPILQTYIADLATQQEYVNALSQHISRSRPDIRCVAMQSASTPTTNAHGALFARKLSPQISLPSSSPAESRSCTQPKPSRLRSPTASSIAESFKEAEEADGGRHSKDDTNLSVSTPESPTP